MFFGVKIQIVTTICLNVANFFLNTKIDVIIATK